MKRLQLVVATAAAVIFAFAAGPVGASAANGIGGQRYYVAVGDSLAFGYQPVDRTNSGHHGYVDQLFAQEEATYHDLTLVNLACPGETTTSMIDGGVCPYAAGNQLATAIAFLQAHRGHVAFATIDIGGNDIDSCAASGSIDATCIANGVATTEANLPVILAALRMASPDTRWVGMSYYDPFLAGYLGNSDQQAMAAASLPVLLGYNDLLEGFFSSFGMRVAGVEAAFATEDSTLVAGVPVNVAMICSLTWMCALGDIHPNTDGYAVIAGAFAGELKR